MQLINDLLVSPAPRSLSLWQREVSSVGTDDGGSALYGQLQPHMSLPMSEARAQQLRASASAASCLSPGFVGRLPSASSDHHSPTQRQRSAITSSWERPPLTAASNDSPYIMPTAPYDAHRAVRRSISVASLTRAPEPTYLGFQLGATPAELLLLPKVWAQPTAAYYTSRERLKLQRRRQQTRTKVTAPPRPSTASASARPSAIPAEVFHTVLQTRSGHYRKRRMSAAEAAQYLLTGVQPVTRQPGSPRPASTNTPAVASARDIVEREIDARELCVTRGLQTGANSGRDFTNPIIQTQADAAALGRSSIHSSRGHSRVWLLVRLVISHASGIGRTQLGLTP